MNGASVNPPPSARGTPLSVGRSEPERMTPRAPQPAPRQGVRVASPDPELPSRSELAVAAAPRAENDTSEVSTAELDSGLTQELLFLDMELIQLLKHQVQDLQQEVVKSEASRKTYKQKCHEYESKFGATTSSARVRARVKQKAPPPASACSC